MNDATVQNFIDYYTDPENGAKQTLPPFPKYFIVSTLHPGSSGSKGSILILQFNLPYRMARIHVDASNANQWRLETENVRRFGFVSDSRRNGVSSIYIDGTLFNGVTELSRHYCKLDATWKICNDWVEFTPKNLLQKKVPFFTTYGPSKAVSERSPSTYGPMIQIYERPLLIVSGTKGGFYDTERYLKVATTLANTLYIQSRTNVEIILDIDFDSFPNPQDFNLFLIGSPSGNGVTSELQPDLPGFFLFFYFSLFFFLFSFFVFNFLFLLVKFQGTSIIIGPKTWSASGTGNLSFFFFSFNLFLFIFISFYLLLI